MLNEKMQKKLADITFVESVSADKLTQDTIYKALNEDDQETGFWFGEFSSAEEGTEAILQYYSEHPEELD